MYFKCLFYRSLGPVYLRDNLKNIFRLCLILFGFKISLNIIYFNSIDYPFNHVTKANEIKLINQENIFLIISIIHFLPFNHRDYFLFLKYSSVRCFFFSVWLYFIYINILDKFDICENFQNFNSSLKRISQYQSVKSCQCWKVRGSDIAEV